MAPPVVTMKTHYSIFAEIIYICFVKNLRSVVFRMIIIGSAIVNNKICIYILTSVNMCVIMMPSLKGRRQNELQRRCEKDQGAGR